MADRTILICADYLFSEVAGGAARCVSELAKELALKKYKVIVLVRGLSENKDFEKADGYDVYRYKSNVLKLFKKLGLIFKNNKVNIINFHDPFTSFFVRKYMFFKSINIPTIYTFHSPWGGEYSIRAIKKKYNSLRIFLGVNIRKKIERFVVKNSSKIALASQFMSETLFKTHRVKSSIVPLGVDVLRFKSSEPGEQESLRSKYNIDGNKKVFFTIRNLEPRMGLENLLEAVKILKDKKYSNLLFIIGGIGSLELELKDKTRKLGIENMVSFAGYIPDTNLPEYYRVSDAFILPTKEFEGFGLVTLEAMASGIPVLATPVAANKEVVGGFDESLLFKSISSEDIADGIDTLLERKDLLELGLKCREHAENNFSWSKYADKMEKIFDELLCL
jgi:glycosyltransferase involved in cell wall biosynthesis